MLIQWQVSCRISAREISRRRRDCNELVISGGGRSVAATKGRFYCWLASYFINNSDSVTKF